MKFTGNGIYWYGNWGIRIELEEDNMLTCNRCGAGISTKKERKHGLCNICIARLEDNMHTPLPWQLDLGIGAPEIVGNSRRIARVLYDPGSEDNEVDYNAEFIVRACNSHADLLEALEKIKEACYSGGRYKISQVDAIATEAIEKAK